MAEVVEDFPERKTRKASGSMYDQYLDGRIWFIPEDEIRTTMNNFRNGAYQRAYLAEIKVRTSVSYDDEKRGVYIQAII